MMNLKEDILNHIASHPEWDLFTKARWIYLKTCSFFSYDWKYFYVSKEDKRKIYQLELDIENIETTDIICSTWCDLFVKLLNLVHIEAWTVTDASLHCYVLFKIDENIYRADATKGYDFSRVKIGCSTNGFYPFKPDIFFVNRLTDCDILLRYKQKWYVDEAIKHINEDFRKENYTKNHDFGKDFDYEQLFYKISLIQSLINTTRKISGFHDTDFYLSYLGRNLFTKLEKNELLIQSFWNLQEYEDIIDFVVVRNHDGKRIYVLKDVNHKYSLLEATNDDIDFYTSHYQGKYENLILQYKK